MSRRGKKMFQDSKSTVVVPHRNPPSFNGNGNGTHLVRQDVSSVPTLVVDEVGTAPNQMVFANLAELRKHLEENVDNYRAGIVVLGGLGSNALEDIVGLDYARYGTLKILYADLDTATMRKTFRDSQELTQKLETWFKNITILTLGGPDSKRGGAGADPTEGKAAAEFPASKEAIKKWLTEVDIVLVVFAAGGGTGSGASEVVIEVANELHKQVIAATVMPKRREKTRWTSAVKVLRKIEKLAPVLVRQNGPMLEWLENSVTPEVYKTFQPKQAWSEVNKRFLFDVFEMFLSLTVDTGYTQNMDARNLEKGIAKRNPDGDETRHVLAATRRLTQQEQLKALEVEPALIVEDLFDNPLGIADIEPCVHSLMIQINGGWSLYQTEGIQNGIEDRIIEAKKALNGSDLPEDYTALNVFVGIGEVAEGERWSVHLFAVAINVTPGENANPIPPKDTKLLPSPESNASETQALPSVKPTSMSHLSVRTTLPQSLIAEHETTSTQGNDVPPVVHTSLLNGYVDGRPKTVRVSEELALEYSKAVREHAGEEVILPLHDQIAKQTVDEKSPEGVRFDLPKHLEVVKEETKQSAWSGFKSAIKPAGLRARPS